MSGNDDRMFGELGLQYVFSGFQQPQPESIEMLDSQEADEMQNNSADDALVLEMSNGDQHISNDEGAEGAEEAGIPSNTPDDTNTNDTTDVFREPDVGIQGVDFAPKPVQEMILQEICDSIVESAYGEDSSEDLPILQRVEVLDQPEEPPLKKQKKDLVAQSSFVCISGALPSSQKFLLSDLSVNAISQVQTVIQEFRRRHTYWKDQGKRKGDMIAYKEMKQLFEQNQFVEKQYVERFRTHGHISGVKIGDQFTCRAEIALVGIHDELIRGIYFIQGAPAYSICLAGAYADDEDKGDFFVYTGEGGQRSGVQVMDQKKENGNLALISCYDKKIPVRVIRGGHDKNKNLSYYYDGLFMVEQYEFCPSQQQKVVSEAKVKNVIEGLKQKQKQGRYQTNISLSENPKIFRFYMRGIPGHCRASQVIQFRNAFQNIRLAQTNISIAGLRFHPYLSQPEIDRRDNKRMEVLKQKESKGEVKILMEDLSQGLERVKIPVVVPREFFKDNVELPDLQYTRDSCSWTAEAEQLSLEYAIYQWSGCGVLRCGDQFNNGGCLLSTDFTGVFECGKDCNRTTSCKFNKITQNKLYLPLEVRWFGKKGYGVTCAVNIPSGAYICEYVGQVMTDLEADLQRKGKDRYLYSMDHFVKLFQLPDEEKPLEDDLNKLPSMSKEHQENPDASHLVIDALYQGGVARFMNHSCNPNCTQQVVLRQHNSFLYYGICFFATREIKAGTELCYDYFWSPLQDTTSDYNQVHCCCGAPQCKGRLL